jgi:hypothetical protein
MSVLFALIMTEFLHVRAVEDQPPGEGGGTQYFPGYTQKK